MQNALNSGSTTFPSGVGAPTCYVSDGDVRQILWRTDIPTNFVGAYSGAPAFLFIRKRPNPNDPAVVRYP